MPRARSAGWRLTVPVVLALAGFLMVTSATTARGTDLRSERRTDLVREQARRAEAGQADLTRLRGRVDALTATRARADRTVAAARSAGNAVAPQAGLTAMTGPGLVVVLDDAHRDPGTPLPAGVTADDVVVHQQDLQAVVNALWAGGAQGVQVMDQRLVSTSAVRCVGNTLVLQGRVYSPPYRVAAVGDVAGMRRALDASPGVAAYRQWVDAVGLGYQLTAPSPLTLPAYGGALALSHAQVAR
jgi:uncharacterized protein YlxW (UPF0749 family)